MFERRWLYTQTHHLLLLLVNGQKRWKRASKKPNAKYFLSASPRNCRKWIFHCRVVSGRKNFTFTICYLLPSSRHLVKQTLLLLLLFPFLLLSAANNFNAAIFLSPFDSLHDDDDDDPITKTQTNKRRTKCCCDRKRFLLPPQFEMEMNRSVRVFSCQKIRKWKSSSFPPLLTSVGTKERCHQLGPHCNNPLLTPIAHCPVG